MAGSGPGMTIVALKDKNAGTLSFGRWLSKFQLAYFEPGKKGAPSIRKDFTNDIYGFIVDKMQQVASSIEPTERQVVVTTFTKEKKPVTDFLFIIRKAPDGIFSVSLKDARIDVTIPILLTGLVATGQERMSDKERSEYFMQDVMAKLQHERTNSLYPMLFDMYQGANKATETETSNSTTTTTASGYNFG